MRHLHMTVKPTILEISIYGQLKLGAVNTLKTAVTKLIRLEFV